MKNKIYLKQYIMFSLISIIIFILGLLFIKQKEYNYYNENYNKKIVAIINKVTEKYPNVSQNEIIELLNQDNHSKEFINKYGIFIDKEAIINENNDIHNRFIVINIIYYVLISIVLLTLFLKYNYSKDRKVKEIVKLVEEINNKNYDFKMQDISEDELSILRNEIYKTTIMLKENAENSLIDKKNLKVYLEDISHQLKTPLTSILIILDNLIDNPDMDKNMQIDFFRDLKRETININNLVHTLLKLSMFDANTIKYIKDDYTIKEIVESAIKNVSLLSEIKNIKINFNPPKNKIIINCDLMWQVEAITNLIKNAIEHSCNESEVNIIVEDNNIYTSIIIENYGEEINKVEVNNIFKRFYKGDKSPSSSNGIGLSLAKTIIENENGTIAVDSSKERTAFIVKYHKYK